LSEQEKRQEKERPQRKYFFQENGRLMVELNYFVDDLHDWGPLSKGERINLAFALGEIYGLAIALSGLDNYDKALDFLYNEENVEEFSKLVDAVEHYHWKLIRNEVRDVEEYLWTFGWLLDSFIEFTARAIKSIKTRNPFDR